MTIVNTDRIKAVQEILLPGDVIALNVFYYEADFVASQDEDDVGAAIEIHLEQFYTTLNNAIVNGAALGDLYCYKQAFGLWDLFSTRAPTDAFAATGELLPHGVSALIRAYTDRVRTIGRKYIPGFGVGSIDDGGWTSSILTALTAAGNEWDDVQNISSGNDLIPGVYSTKSGFVQALNGTEVIPAYPGYQRRRRPGVGI
jgi:hypothetical protein